MPKKLERTTFEASRAAEYFDKRNLAALTGVSAPEFPAVVVKELADNALDAAEADGVAPKLWIASVVRDGRALAIAVEDNGPGIRPEVVRSVLNYNVRVSDKAAYRSPTRGAQGNALKTVVGIPYALGVRQPLTIEACGVHHEIEPSIDPAGNVRIAHEESNGARTKGTRVELQVAPADAAWWSGRPIQWARSFAIFNPHAQISYLRLSGSRPTSPLFTNRVFLLRTSGSTGPPTPPRPTGTAPTLLRSWSSPTLPRPSAVGGISRSGSS